MQSRLECGPTLGDESVNLVETVAHLDERTELHTLRLLLLLDAFAADANNPSIEGLTKLAKLDFLLRYPVMLERALLARQRSTGAVELADHERHSVESAMVRYRFGPWDHRYREFLNVLAAKGLVSVGLDGRKVMITATPAGRAVAATVAEDPLFEQYVSRARILKRHFDLTGTHLMKFIYETFPEVP
jgi:hypothetical protein